MILKQMNVIGLLAVFTCVPCLAQDRPYNEQIPGTEMHIDMVPIPGGTFLMGSPSGEKGHKADEGPQIRVRMDPFYMSKLEITWPQYKAFTEGYSRVQRMMFPANEVPKDRLADAVTYPTPIYDMEFAPHLQRMGGTASKPADLISHFAARQFTKWLSGKTNRFYRLPTEAEWEYACRAGTTTAYSFGDDMEKLPDHAWFVDNSKLKDGDTGYHTVGEKRPNAWGLYDMHGNVAEWCLDQYQSDWYRQFAGKTVDWHDVINWPTSRYPCVIRGGGYDSEPQDCRSAARLHSTKELNASDPYVPKSSYWEAAGDWIGFRVVSPQVEPGNDEKNRYWNAADKQTIDATNRDRDAHEIVTPGGK